MTFPGYISANEIYTLSECKRRLRLGRHSFKRLRQVGLRTLRFGRSGYVRGVDLIAAVEAAAEQQACDVNQDGAQAAAGEET